VHFSSTRADLTVINNDVTKELLHPHSLKVPSRLLQFKLFAVFGGNPNIEQYMRIDGTVAV
jgi:hypothetical protein